MADAAQTDHRAWLIQWKRDNNKTNAEIAALLSERTGDRISQRSVENWLGDPAKASSRRCPGWVVFVLRRHCQPPQGTP